MKTVAVRKQLPFSFIFEELISIRPSIKRMFGFTHVYLDETLLFSLRDSAKQPGTNGMWLYTTTEHIETLPGSFLSYRGVSSGVPERMPG